MLRPTLRIFALVLAFTVAPQVFADDQHGIKDLHKGVLVQKDRFDLILKYYIGQE